MAKKPKAAPAARATVPSAAAGSSQTTVIICTLLVILTLGAYWNSGSCGFVNLDDDAYVEFQPMVNQGLRSAALVWAFTGVHSTNWHPLTSLSHIMDCTLFGVQPSPMHLENIFLHVLNTLLVFFLWKSLSRKTWPAAFIAACFALHPLHVESVAWISERKDVLSAFFWLLGLYVYVLYVRHPSWRRYALLTLCLVLGLLAKPMTVTFPVTLLLLDYWPLNRLATKTWRALLHEKIPLFALAITHALITILVQSSAGAANYGARFSLMERIGNALVSYTRYLGKTLWPAPLSPFYPHPGHWPLWAVGGSLLFLLAVTAFAWMQRRARPWLLFGWLWFLVTLAPVIGILQVGAQSMADRYTYIPLLGIFTILACAGGELIACLPKTRTPIAAAAGLAIAAFFLLTLRQVGAWKNSVTLYLRTIAAGEDNATVRYLLGLSLQSAGHPEGESRAQFLRAIELQHDYVNAYTQLCMLAIRHQDFAEARRLMEQTIAFEPLNPALHSSYGALCRIMGKPDEAVVHLQQALKLNPNSTEAHREFAWMYFQQKEFLKASQDLEAITRVSPWDFAAWNDLGAAYLDLGNREDARRCFERSAWINPQAPDAPKNLRALAQ